VSDPDDEPFVIVRPYPFIICNAAHPSECKREPDGYCPKCHITGFHEDRAASSASALHKPDSV